MVCGMCRSGAAACPPLLSQGFQEPNARRQTPVQPNYERRVLLTCGQICFQILLEAGSARLCLRRSSDGDRFWFFYDSEPSNQDRDSLSLLSLFILPLLIFMIVLLLLFYVWQDMAHTSLSGAEAGAPTRKSRPRAAWNRNGKTVNSLVVRSSVLSLLFMCVCFHRFCSVLPRHRLCPTDGSYLNNAWTFPIIIIIMHTTTTTTTTTTNNNNNNNNTTNNSNNH